MTHKLGQNTKYLIFRILKYLYVEDNQLSLSQTISKQSKRHWTKYLISRHFCEGGVQLLGDGLELVLFPQQLILQSVNLRAYQLSIMSILNRDLRFQRRQNIFTSFCSLMTDFSANSALVSDCFSFPVNLLISSL